MLSFNKLMKRRVANAHLLRLLSYVLVLESDLL